MSTLTKEEICILKELQAFLKNSFMGSSIGPMKIDEAAEVLKKAIHVHERDGK